LEGGQLGVAQDFTMMTINGTVCTWNMTFVGDASRGNVTINSISYVSGEKGSFDCHQFDDMPLIGGINYHLQPDGKLLLTMNYSYGSGSSGSIDNEYQ
jgi:hypothetical protein